MPLKSARTSLFTCSWATEAALGETRSWTADYTVKSGPQFDVGGGVRVWRNLSAHGSYARFSDSRVAAIAGQVPHPFFFDRPRTIDGESARLKQEEQAIHIAAAWTFATSRHLDVSVFGGPSMYMLKRDLVSDVSYADDYPYDSATFGSATVQRASENGLGFHAGADITWLFSRTVGVGGVIRFTRASVSADSPAHGGTVPLDLGGLQVGAGLRLRLGHPRTQLPVTPARRSQPPRARDPEALPEAGAQMPSPIACAAPKRTSTTLRAAAPVYIRPDAEREPLMVLPAGTKLAVRQDLGEWLMVEFEDPRGGARMGYVPTKFCDW